MVPAAAAIALCLAVGGVLLPGAGDDPQLEPPEGRPSEVAYHRFTKRYVGDIWIRITPARKHVGESHRVTLRWGPLLQEVHLNNLDRPRTLFTGKNRPDRVTLRVDVQPAAAIAFGEGNVPPGALNIKPGWTKPRAAPGRATSSRLPVVQPSVPGIALRDKYGAPHARAYAVTLKRLKPRFVLSFNSQAELKEVRHATASRSGLFGGSSDKALTGTGRRPVPSLRTISALVGGAERTVVLWVRTDVRARQTILDAGRSFTAARMLLALTDPAGVPQAPDHRHGVVAVFYDSDVLLPGLELADNQWHQIAVALADDQALVMVDGALPRAEVWDGVQYGPPQRQPVTLPSAPATDETRVSLTGAGAHTTIWRRGLRGQIDELAIFDRALPPLAIASLWRAAGGARG